MNQKAIVLEVNETPLRVLRRFQELQPGSNIDRLMKSSMVIETLAKDVDESSLYPSQSWASMNTGAAYDDHKIHWYNDPKPAEYPMFWKVLADNGKSVGLVNTLHSSPAGEMASTNDRYRFVLPDCFATDDYAKPSYLIPFQSFNLKTVSANQRATQMKAPVKEAALTVLNSPRYGIRMQTMWDGASLLTQILRKKVNRERFRNFQFPLAADIFLKLFRQHDPDFGVLFTNHVAGNMHRYWYALFPEDYPEKVYDEAWVSKYRNEIMVAVNMLDGYLGRFMRLAESTGRVLMVVSSMGQHANQSLTPDVPKQYAFIWQLTDLRHLVQTVTGKKYEFEIESAMFPQYGLSFPSAAKAEKFLEELNAALKETKGFYIGNDVNENKVTLHINVYADQGEPAVRGQAFTHAQLGFTKLDVDDHHSGKHCPEGSLVVYNSKTAKCSTPSVNYLEYAPALLKFYGIPKLPYMMEPSFTL